MENNYSLPANVVNALKVGSKIEAIKLLRITQGIDLKIAKERVEQYMEQNKQVFGSSQQQQDRSGVRFIFFIVIIALAYTAYRYFSN